MSACEATSGCYELYSIGSAKFLREIFNSVAMITGSGDFLGACAVAIMLGVILAVIKGIMTGGGKIEVGAIVVSSLVTCIMFVPRATVVVEDVYNGSTYAVDNVPIGVAAPGMFISRVGFTIAELMDQGFSTVDTNFGITNRPFLESTKILSNLRNPQFANSVWDQLGKHTNSDVKRSFYNFFKECTMLKYNFDKTKSVDQDQKMTLENLMDDFQSNVFYTEIYVDGKAVTKTCNDANAILKSKINQLNSDLVNNAMPAPKEYGSNTATEMTDAISMLRLTSADAMEMVKLSIVQPVYDKALAGYFDNSGDVVAALTINNAIQQRNAQWSMEQSLFLNTVRPIITFFEGFVYAVTPFMAILICMGAFGLGIAVKYFQTLIWIQLWMPILAIINLYIYMSAQGAVDSAGIVDKHIDSFYALGTLAQTVETWTSVGGMLAAMTPVIAFFIVAGSAYTFTSIASKLNGADHIDEKAMSPDVLKQAPFATNTAGSYKISSTGAMYSDRENQLPSIGFGYSDYGRIESSYNSARTTLSTLGTKIGDTFAHNVTSGQGWGSKDDIGRIIGSSGNIALQKAFQMTQGQQYNNQNEWLKALQSNYDLALKMSSGSTTSEGSGTHLTTRGGAGASGSTGHSQNTSTNSAISNGGDIKTIQDVRNALNRYAGIDYNAGVGVSHDESIQQHSSVSEENSANATTHQTVGTTAKVADGTNDTSSTNTTDSNSLSFSDALSKAASNYYQTNGGITDGMGLTAEETKAFNESWQDVKQYGNTVGEQFSSDWKQEVSLKDLANDVNNSEDGKSRISKLYNGFNNSQRERVASLSNLYRDKFGIEDADLAKSMAVLQTAYQGSTENKNEVFDLFNDNFGGNRKYAGDVKAPEDYKDNRGASENRGKEIKKQAKGREQQIRTDATAGVNNNADAYNDAKNNFTQNQWGRIQQYLEGTPYYKKVLENYDNSSYSAMYQAAGQQIEFIPDQDGFIDKIRIGGEDFSKDKFERDGMIRKGFKNLWECFGQRREDIISKMGPSVSSIEGSHQYMQQIPESLRNLIQGNSNLNSGNFDELKKNDLLMKYANDNKYDLSNSNDQQKLRKLAAFISLTRSAYNGQIGNNYANRMIALIQVARNDANKAETLNYINNQLVQIDSMKGN